MYIGDLTQATMSNADYFQNKNSSGEPPYYSIISQPIEHFTLELCAFGMLRELDEQSRILTGLHGVAPLELIDCPY